MKRTIAASVLLLLLVPALPPAGALGIPEHWDSDRTLRANMTVPAPVDLVIGQGLNISFEPEQGLPDFSPVFLNIGGGLGVCGTKASPTVLRASRDFFYSEDMPGGYLNITGNGEPGQLAVRNCSFENIIIIVVSAAGQFTDCVFNGTYLYVADSTARFVNCRFLGAAMSIYSPSSQNQTVLSGCVFDPTGRMGWDPYWGNYSYFSYVPAIKLSGYALIERCTIRGFGSGIQSYSGVPEIRGCSIRDCGYGIELRTTDPADRPLVEDCAIQNCSLSALKAEGNLLLRNCTLSNSTYGLELENHNFAAGPVWNLSGNRIFGNSGVGISVTGGDPEVADTRFEDGAGNPNLEGRVARWGSLLVEISTRGTQELEDVTVNLTDSLGELTNGSRSNAMRFNFPDLLSYVVDNSGQRMNGYPYTVRAQWNGVRCETSVGELNTIVTLYLPILPDLVPVGISLDPPSPREGDWVAISCPVNNTGPMQSERVQALFTLDGERLDLAELFPVEAYDGSVVRAVDWKARRGSHTVTVRLDAQNAQEEDDETNNELTFNFTVGEAPPPSADRSGTAYAGGAAAVILALACAGGYLVLRRRRRAKGG